MSDNTDDKKTKKGLSTGAIIGIVIASIVIVIASIVLINKIKNSKTSSSGHDRFVHALRDTNKPFNPWKSY